MKNILLSLFACLSLPLLRAQDPYYAPPFTIISSEYILKKGGSSIFADLYEFENKQVLKNGTTNLNFKSTNFPYDPDFFPNCTSLGSANNTKYFKIPIAPDFTNGIVRECMPQSDSMKFGIGTYFEKPNGDIMYIGYSKKDAISNIAFELRNSNNQVKSFKKIGGYHQEHPFRIRESIDGGYIGVANYSGFGDGDIGMGDSIKCGDYFSFDIWLFKTDSLGNVIKSLVFGGPYEDAFGDIHVDAQGNVMVFLMIANGGQNCQLQSCRTSETGWQEGTDDLLGVKLDKDLNILWSRCYGGSGSEGWRGNVRIVPDGSGGYFVATRTSSSDGMLAAHPWNGIPERRETNPGIGSDLWVFRIDRDGNILKSNSIPFERAEVTDMALSKDGTLWVGVYSRQYYYGLTMNEEYFSSGAMVLHLDSSLNMIHKRYLGGNGSNRIHSISALEDTTVLIALEYQITDVRKPTQWLPPYNYGENGYNHAVVFFKANGKTDTLSDHFPSTGTFTMFPNPAQDKLYIETPGEDKYTVYLYHSDGRKAGAFTFHKKQHIQDISGLEAGLYTVVLTQDNKTVKVWKLAKQ